MINHIIPLEEKNRKVFGFTEQQFIFSSKSHDTFDSLLAATEKSGMLETVKTIPVSAMSGLEFNEKEESFTINYSNKKGKVKSESIAIKNVDQRDEIVAEIASLKNLSKSIEEESKTTPLLLNSAGVALIVLLTWIARGMAVDAQNGEHYVATGRRRGLAQLVGNAIESIGPLGVTVIGVLGLSYMIYRTYDRYSNPAKETKYN